MSFLGGVLEGIGSLFGGGSGSPSKGFITAGKYGNAITKAMLYPDTSKIFQRIAAFEEERRMLDMAESMRNFMAQNRRETAAGFPLLNPERRDESIANAVTTQMQRIPIDARQATLAYLGQAATANAGMMGAFAQPYMVQQGYNQNVAGTALHQILGGVGGLLNGNPAQTGDLTSILASFGGSGTATPWNNPNVPARKMAQMWGGAPPSYRT